MTEIKIVFLAPFGIRPKGTVIARMLPLAVELQRVGHAVTIVVPPYTNPEDSGKTEILRGVRLINISLPNVGKVLGALPMAWRMLRAALKEKPTLVHLFKPKGYGGLAAMLIVILARLGCHMPPLFVDTDDWEGKGGMNSLHSYSPIEKRLFAFQEQWLSRHSAGMTVASRELERLTHELGVPPEHILYMPNGVEETVLGSGDAIRQKLGIVPETPVVLLYTRFFEFTQERLYRVFIGICRQVPGVRFLVVGKGRRGEEEQLLSAGREYGFADALIMTGWVEPHEIPDYLAVADVAIYPLDDTIVNRAKCPAKLTEIICAGIPVVADKVGQAMEYIHDVDWLCIPEDEMSMVEKVVTAINYRHQSKLSGGQLRRHIFADFAWNKMTAGLENFYRQTL
jgi:glycosyltransferase involved in cell wall biosynthesis